jgi:superfamily II DNA or RNA helicase|nr:SNF2-related protein [Caldimonas sp.]
MDPGSRGTELFASDFDRCLAAFAIDVQLGKTSFFGRKALREAASKWYLDCEGVPTLLGGRIRPMAHQIHAALKVIRDRTQRFLLADEVGLGKTIEAGMIIQALFHHRPEMSVLVVAPGSMVLQWQRELYLRFGARVFAVLDGTAHPAERKRVLGLKRVIVSITALLQAPGLRTELQDIKWETLVVDEAHHLDARHPLYAWTRTLSMAADHMLVLSATPSKREVSGLAALLALVSPHDFEPSDTTGLEKRIAAREEIWATLDRVMQLLKAAYADKEAFDDPSVVAVLVDEFGRVFREDERISKWLTEATRLASKSVESALKLVERALVLAQERWRVDHRIIRTRRKALEFLAEPFARREYLGEVGYEPSAGEMAVAALLRELPVPRDESEATWYVVLDRFASTTPDLLLAKLVARRDALKRGSAEADGDFARALASDPGPQEEEALLRVAAGKCPPLQRAEFDELAWLESMEYAANSWARQDGQHAARLKAAAHWCRTALADDPSRKLLVFSQENGVVQAFAELLEDVELEVRLFHQEMTDADRQDAALEFARSPEVQVLVSDELGGEGLNLQVAWAILHLDVPTSPSRLEQRIGRLDRIGRSADRPVLSAVMLGGSDGENLRQVLHRDVFRVYKESIGGLEFVMPLLQREARSGFLCGEAERQALVTRLAAQVEEARQQADGWFHTAMDTTRADLQRANEIAEYLVEVQSGEQFAPAGWLRALGVGVERDAGDSNSRISWNPDRLESAIPGVHTQDEFRATWSRSCALKEERRQFLAPGHRLIDGAYHLLDVGDIGRAAGLDRKLGQAGKNKFFALAVFVDALPETAASLPAGLVAKARAVVGRDCNLAVLRYDDVRGSWVTEGDPALVAQLRKATQIGDLDWLDQKRKILEVDGLIDSLRRGLRSASQSLAEQVANMNGGVAKELEEAWGVELAYLGALTESDDANERERARIDCNLRLETIDRVRDVSPRLDALMIVRGV